jgi:hypothetical protein
MEHLPASIDPVESHTRIDQSIHTTVTADDETRGVDAVLEKLNDALTPGYHAEFDPPEADLAGAFAEDALSDEDASASTEDSLRLTAL